jgi:dTDP-4-dehydrorhamnose 3,5-epimerase
MSPRFEFIETALAGLYRVDRKPITDVRGFFSRFYCAEEFEQIGLNRPIAQMNHTLTMKKGAVRGMHFQYSPYTETKIITCIKGEVLDVAVDIRKGSPTFLQWHAERLSAKNQSSLYIPDGFAHGFQALTESCQLLYLHTNIYHPDAEGALNAQDPKLNINWLLEITEMSERDHNHPMLKTDFKGIEV